MIFVFVMDLSDSGSAILLGFPCDQITLETTLGWQRKKLNSLLFKDFHKKCCQLLEIAGNTLLFLFVRNMICGIGNMSKFEIF